MNKIAPICFTYSLRQGQEDGTSRKLTLSIIEHTLKLCTKANRELITEGLVQIIMDEIETKLLDLYYFSLESLRKSLERDYDADFSYSYSCGCVGQFHGFGTIN